MISLIVFTCLLCFFTSCDLEKVTGYKYDARQPDNLVKISGTVVNVFTGEGAAHINISIGPYKTKTDVTGTYQLFYQKGEDEDMNLPIPVEIVSSKYETYSSEILIAEEDFTYNINLIYAAPMLESVYRGFEEIYAVVKDYQGNQDIAAVRGDFRIEVLDGILVEQPYQEIRELTRIGTLTATTAEYYIPVHEQFFRYDPRVAINKVRFIMWDQGGHCDTTAFFALHQIQNN